VRKANKMPLKTHDGGSPTEYVRHVIAPDVYVAAVSAVNSKPFVRKTPEGEVTKYIVRYQLYDALGGMYMDTSGKPVELSVFVKANWCKPNEKGGFASQLYDTLKVAGLADAFDAFQAALPRPVQDEPVIEWLGKNLVGKRFKVLTKTVPLKSGENMSVVDKIITAL
jgi:hypothetical protein